MSFASTYIEQRILFPRFINEAPHDKTGIITVIPSYGEDNIVRLLESLASAASPSCKVEVMVVVNAPGDASSEALEKNRITLKDIESWNLQENSCWFRLFSLEIKPGAIPGWGVGLARKTGMDEAVRRYHMINNPDGIILSLDADCRVETSYFSAVYDEFTNRKVRKACSIYFEHDLEGNEFPEEIYNHITLYELHLRYYYQGLKYSGYPWVYHTVGSAMAVKAHDYVMAGGMNRKQAGEDFYLIQKLITGGGYFSLNKTTVYPSPRPSFRVPFGTGAAISRLAEGDGENWMTYSVEAFEELRYFFSRADLFFECQENQISRLYHDIPEGIRLFIAEDIWISKITEIKRNTSALQSFRKRFFSWFNMFMIVRYLNTVHHGFYTKVPVDVAASELLTKIGFKESFSNARNLLHIYRRMEKES
ncbi:MAG TPA: glycosyltransferase family A protein [Bacteroidales bacterium]|nr:glycosyltransferase family A protein [Bacteroidales bacterium]